MTGERKFYRTRVTFEVISEDAPISESWSLKDIEFEFSEGSLVAGPVEMTTTQLDGKAARATLVEFGSEAAFFFQDEED